MSALTVRLLRSLIKSQPFLPPATFGGCFQWERFGRIGIFRGADLGRREGGIEGLDSYFELKTVYFA